MGRKKFSLARLTEDARTADELHEHSRELLVQSVRSAEAAGFSQREIARAIGRSQPEVSRLLRFQAHSPLGRLLVKNRRAVLQISDDRGVTNLRVFGSVARGTDTPASDIDFLADVAPGVGLFSLAKLERDLSELLHVEVDVVPARSLRQNLAEAVLAEAVRL